MRVVELDAAGVDLALEGLGQLIPDYAQLPNGELVGNAFYFLKLPA